MVNRNRQSLALGLGEPEAGLMNRARSEARNWLLDRVWIDDTNQRRARGAFQVRKVEPFRERGEIEKNSGIGAR